MTALRAGMERRGEHGLVCPAVGLLSRFTMFVSMPISRRQPGVRLQSVAPQACCCSLDRGAVQLPAVA